MAVVPVDTYALGYYAVDSGIFAKAGIEVELHTFSTGGQITGAVAAGAIDVGLADPLQVGQAINRGVNFKYFAGGTEYTSASATTQLCVQSGGVISVTLVLGCSTTIVCSRPPTGSRQTWTECTG